MVEQAELTGVGVLVTRPRLQADELCRLIASRGGEPIRFPTIEIIANPLTEDEQRSLGESDGYDWLVFISANAVRYGVETLASDRQLPPIAAIGPATAKALSDHSLSTALVPEQGFTSEDLLATSEMSEVEGKRILIVRGVGGRETLGQTLNQRGAEVRYAEVYRRMLPTVDPQFLHDVETRWVDGDIQYVTVGSVEALVNLDSLLGERGQRMLRHTPLVTASARVVKKATAMGVRCSVLNAAGPGDDRLVDAIVADRRDRRPQNRGT